MKLYKLSDMKGGWFIGNFEPTVIQSPLFEVAYKNYSAGNREAKHVHKVATELTVIAFGRVCMNGVEYSAGDIVVLEPGDVTDFEAIDDAATVVVKLPSVAGDKYLV